MTEELFGVAVFCITGAALSLVLRQYRPEYAVLVSLGCSVVVLLWVITGVAQVMDELNSLLEAQQRKGRQYAPMASFYVDSDTLENVKRLHELLESLFPVAVAAAVLIGVFGPGLVIIQSSREAAFLRILGVTKKCARCMLVCLNI